MVIDSREFQKIDDDLMKIIARKDQHKLDNDELQAIRKAMFIVREVSTCKQKIEAIY